MQSAKLKIFLTSRPALPIRFGFKTTDDAYDGIILHEIPESVIKKDIRAFLIVELEGIRERYNVMALGDCQLPSDWPAPSQVETFVTMAVPRAAGEVFEFEQRRRPVGRAEKLDDVRLGRVSLEQNAKA